MDKEAENESLEDNLQNAQHQKRRDILRFIDEHKQALLQKLRKPQELKTTRQYHTTLPTCKLL